MQVTTYSFSKRSTGKNSCRKILLLLFLFALSSSLYSQVALVKMVGKNSGNSNIGFGVFWNWEIPVNDIGNRNIMLELMDFSYFPRKHSEINSVIGYLSIKAGYKYIFSEETKTGFYIEPSLGYCRVVSSEDRDDGETLYGDGVALAVEAGYSLEVGQQANTLNFGLKYESDLAGAKTTVSSVGFRFSYSFHLFRKRND